MDKIIVSTTEKVAGHKTGATLGQVFGVVVRSRGLGGNNRGRPALDHRRRDQGIYRARRGDAAPWGRSPRPERGADRCERGGDDAFRFGIDRPEDERGRRLRQRSGRRAGSLIAVLRPIISGTAITAVAFTLVLAMQEPGAWPALAASLAIAIACLWERRYRAAQQGFPTEARFNPTGERFVDPETGRATSAWVNPSTGERRYVDEGDPPSPSA